MAPAGGPGAVVVAPAHLHAGNMDLTGDLERLYGTAGFTIDYPRTVIEAHKSDRTTVTGEEKENAERYVSAFMERFNVEGGITVNIKETIPKHLGLGSQTALALSIGFALSELYAIPTSIEEIALALGRSDIVALGLYSFKTGGSVVDGGYRVKEKGRSVPPLLFRHPIPEDWLFVICIPHEPIPAILKIKENEEEILNNLKPMQEQMSNRLSRIMLMQLMPSIIEHDIKTFGKSITAFNSRLGDFWSEFQGGCTYCHPLVEEGIEILLHNGAYGACQSSWGPTFYGIVNNGGMARELVERLKQPMEKEGGGDVFYTIGNNRGASIRRW